MSHGATLLAHCCCRALRGVVFATLLTWAACAGESGPGGRDEMALCRGSLNRMMEALKEYEKVHQTLPENLSDLHPEFVADPRLFICPLVLSMGDHVSWRREVRHDVFVDPLPTSYAYEFNTREYPLWVGQSSTWRELKERQMKLLGGNIPIVRCMTHDPMLFLSVGGQIHESGLFWESAFSHLIDAELLYPHNVFKDLAPLPGRFTNGISPRDPAAPARLLDLSPYYIAPLRSPWLWSNPQGEDLSELPEGIVRFDSIPVEFDVRGLIQLSGQKIGAPFPPRVDGIRVGQKCRRLHFIEGAVRGLAMYNRTSTDPPGTEIGWYRIRYKEGDPETIPIRYGQDLLSWDFRGENPSVDGAEVAWVGENDESRRRESVIRLYRQQWTNPHPEREIASIDFESAQKIASPFLIAITLEP